MLAISLAGHYISKEEAELLALPSVGGLVLFTENDNPALSEEKRHLALKDLIASVKKIRPDLCIMVDHEGGKIWRFHHKSFTELPSAKHYGELFDTNPEEAIASLRKDACTMAKELLACGIDRSLAPVCDYDGNSSIIGKYDRAFHHDTESLVTLVSAFIEGFHEAGMPVTLKHWPGHGSILPDSHIELPTDLRSLEEIQNTDLRPFTRLIQSGVLSHPQDAIMLAHIAYPNIDKDHLPCLSSTWIKILRESGFTGPIMTDCLSMKAIASSKSPEISIPLAKTAGCQWILCTHTPAETLLKYLSLT
jgi:beta-N-acetylhexosaminidase